MAKSNEADWWSQVRFVFDSDELTTNSLENYTLEQIELIKLVAAGIAHRYGQGKSSSVVTLCYETGVGATTGDWCEQGWSFCSELEIELLIKAGVSVEEFKTMAEVSDWDSMWVALAGAGYD